MKHMRLKVNNMNFKAYSDVMLVMLLILTTSLSCNIQIVKAENTIYIRNDGSVDPITAPIATNDNVVYFMIKDIQGSVSIQKNNIVFDGNGHTIQGNGSASGIELINRSNVIIKNVIIKRFTQGIYLNNSNNCTIEKNEIIANYLRGIWVVYSSYNHIVNNNITLTNWEGIWLKQSSNYNIIYGNNIYRNQYGVSLSRWCENNKIFENVIKDNDYALGWGDTSDNNFIFHNIFINNSVPVTSPSSLKNFYDDGYPSGGNYWSGYKEADHYRGINQDIAGSDSIGDVPYRNSNFIDNYPLMVPYVTPPKVTIDEVIVGNPRCNIGSIQKIGFHVKWGNETDVNNGLIYINGVEYKTNSSGWVLFNEVSQIVIKKTWKVTAVNCSGITGFTQFVASPSIIWDRVNVTLRIVDNRIDFDLRPELEWSAIYEYDGSTFQGKVNIQIINSQTSIPTPIGKGSYRVESIEDSKYSLTSFTSNQVDCVFDRVKIIQGGVSNPTTKTGNMESVWFKAVYEYDNEEFTGETTTDGGVNKIFVNGIPLVWSSFDKVWKYSTKLDDNGKLTFEVTGVEDMQYKLTKFIDAAGPQTITWEKPFLETPVGMVSVAAVLVIIVAGVIFFLRKRL